ncbi:MAG: thiamine ABC transporter substrate-binding protein [Spirochaetes bacterium]|jgi:thiamine transport system substrate-binding protein|nr:thiamine ABC transporter substrate-binding protein [Spirochaetota bacterium]
MKRLMTLILILLIFLATTACSKNSTSNSLTIYTYDSFSWFTEKMVPEFEREHNCTVKVILFESTSKIITRLILEKNNPKADIAIGITPTMLAQAISEDLFEKYKSPAVNSIKNRSLIFDSEFYTTPYDYGALAVVYNPETVKTIPNNFSDFLDQPKSLIIQDPRTSSTGTDFLLWTIAIYGNEWKDFWRDFRHTVLTAPAGWSESFAKFEAGEAPMMVSYATDTAYSIHNYGSSTYKTVIPGQKAYVQIEGVSLVKGSQNFKPGKAFIDFMLSDQFQKEIPLNQWMFPVIDMELPEVFSHALVPDKTVSIPTAEISANLEKWLKEWEDIMASR